ncbi:AI-2E family transporter [Arcanobacterium phocae]|uniref:Predicted PurR-regulated permease PerM n=1 Tax=Arcanobacterium phocae TaxID=131112 RepID=A0A1H2LBR2_9ACTO|nr:AI-2E family transporter [Arcanobacterium phocae]SDU78443.1 Predicted PurR-regulated permease PerM [Arcanobacterium phocae]
MSQQNDDDVVNVNSAHEQEKVSEPAVDINTSGFMILAVLALTTVVGIGVHSVADVFTPLFLAFTLVLAVRPFGQFLMRHHLPSWLASLTTLILTLAIIAGLLGMTVWSLTPVPDLVLEYSGKMESTMYGALQWLQNQGVNTRDLSYYAGQVNVNSIVSWTWSLVGGLFSFGGLLSIVAIAAFFLTLDTTVTRSRGQIVNQGHWNMGEALRGFERRVRHYWIVTTVFGLVVAFVDGLVLETMSIPLAWTWAYWAFITNYVPNIGFVIGVIPPMIIGLLDSGWQTMLWVFVAYTVINVVIQTLIQPKMTGDIVGLSPSVTFFSLVVWTSIVGMLGSILAVPLTLFFKALLVDSDPRTRWLDVYLISENEAARRRKDGYYDNPETFDDTLPELLHPLTEFERKARLRYRPKLQALSRQLKRSPKKEG